VSLSKQEIVVAIHQPNFFPWLGYFDKIIRSDVFVFLDNVARQRTGSGTWLNRVKLLIQGKPIWVSCPIIKSHGFELIKDVKIDNSQKWKGKIYKTLIYNYTKAPFFKQTMEWLAPLLFAPYDYLIEYNINNITAVCRMLNINTTFISQSDLMTTNKSTDLLIEITKKIGGTAYLCGGGAAGYQEDDKFPAAGISLIYQNFIHPIYSQIGIKNGDFVSGLSIIDAVMNCGVDDVKRILLQSKAQKENSFEHS
jgi:hypothetical protein